MERYLQLLIKDHPHITQRLSNKMVANYLGITQEALSRLLKNKLYKNTTTMNKELNNQQVPSKKLFSHIRIG